MQQYTHENATVQVQPLTAIKDNSQSQESPRQRAHGKSKEKPQNRKPQSSKSKASVPTNITKRSCCIQHSKILPNHWGFSTSKNSARQYRKQSGTNFRFKC